MYIYDIYIYIYMCTDEEFHGEKSHISGRSTCLTLLV